LAEDYVITVDDLHTYFRTQEGLVRAVDGASFGVKRGKVLGVVGESGCGKSVTARSVMQLIQSPPGKIVEGDIFFYRNQGQEVVEITQLDPKGPGMRRIRGGQIAMVFQEPMTSLNPLFTIGSQIAEAVQLHRGVSSKEASDLALEMLDRVRIADPQQRIKEYPHQLSGGMRQRVMIAMALSCNPEILIADEPTTALDVTVQAQILDLMNSLQRDFGSSIILITHNLGVVSQMADFVAVMYLGKIVEYSDVRTVFHSPLHPYTVGLLNSVPVFGKKKENRVLVPIRGMVPSPTEEIPGCSFAPRCPQAMEVCSQQHPVLKEVEKGHQVSCWLY
jgi:oligopeptide/dipeptide ABC transporter ATP-binding protein